MSPQHMDALHLANEVRRRIAELRRELRLRTGAESARLAASVLRCPDEMEGRMRVFDLVCAVRRVGPRGADRLLAEARIAVRRRTVRVEAMTDRERRALADLLDERAGGERAK